MCVYITVHHALVCRGQRRTLVILLCPLPHSLETGFLTKPKLILFLAMLADSKPRDPPVSSLILTAGFQVYLVLHGCQGCKHVLTVV